MLLEIWEWNRLTGNVSCMMTGKWRPLLWQTLERPKLTWFPANFLFVPKLSIATVLMSVLNNVSLTHVCFLDSPLILANFLGMARFSTSSLLWEMGISSRCFLNLLESSWNLFHLLVLELFSSSDFLHLQKAKIQTFRTHWTKITTLASKLQSTFPAPTKPLGCLKLRPNTPSL